jgi:PPM family protein phosphatase
MSTDADTIDWSLEELETPQHFAPLPPAVRVEFGAVSHPGKVRENNEDHYLVFRRQKSRTVLKTNLPCCLTDHTEDAYTMIVADGIGGSAFGEVASTLALEAVWDLGLQQVRLSVKVNEREAADLSEKVETAFNLIHESLVEHAEHDPRLAGMGTTLTAVHTIGADAIVGHVGDSRAYLFRAGALTRLTHDHTLREELIKSGLADADAPSLRYVRHVLTRCLGGHHHTVQPDIHRLTLADGDCLLLSTDGLHDLVEDSEIARVLGEQVVPDAACQTLLNAALDRGGKDNITIIVARYAIGAVP